MGSLIRTTAEAVRDAEGNPAFEVVAQIGFDLAEAETAEVADVLIDFSNVATLPAVLAYVSRCDCALVSGTTGYTPQQMELLRKLGETAPVLHSANFSVGIAVLRRVLAQISDVLRPDFDIEIVETHHNQKADAPSGTAKLLLEAIDPRHELTPVYGREGLCGKRRKNEVGVHALRGGTVAGQHTVHFFGADEALELTHTATSRQIFVNGALHMARKLQNYPKGRYDLQEILFGGNAL